MAYKPVVLVVLDGVGVPPSTVSETPFYTAKLPLFREFERMYPFTTLRASGVAVGLPWGEEGNSEVGHLTMGAGRVIYHHLPRIITSIHEGSFFQNDSFMRAAEHVRTQNSTMHYMGLFSSGSVHAYADHLYALLEFAAQQKLERVMVHLFTDGRDAPRDEGARFVKSLEERIQAKFPHAKIASIIGRHFAMDRDGNWDRTERAYNLFCKGEGTAFSNPVTYIEESYRKEVWDEFIEPGFLSDENGSPVGRIREGDAVVYFDFREDSARQLTSAFVLNDFSGFERKKLASFLFVTMTEYDSSFPAMVAFPPIDIERPLARIVAEAGLQQLHVAETEKYAHVTYFFNGGKEKPFPGEERALVQSSHGKDIIQHPEMAAEKIAEAVITGLQRYDFILANFANGDMVGHTGDFDATARALEILDTSLTSIRDAVLEKKGVLVITADHGNAEEKRYRTSGEPRTKHTINAVPLYLVGKNFRRKEPRKDAEVQTRYKNVEGVLTDVAPTVLELLGLEQPPEMTGASLLALLTQEK